MKKFNKETLIEVIGAIILLAVTSGTISRNTIYHHIDDNNDTLRRLDGSP